MGNPSTSPSRWRSSGTWAVPSSVTWRGVACVISLFIRSLCADRLRRPVRASTVRSGHCPARPQCPVFLRSEPGKRYDDRTLLRSSLTTRSLTSSSTRLLWRKLFQARAELHAQPSWQPVCSGQPRPGWWRNYSPARMTVMRSATSSIPAVYG